VKSAFYQILAVALPIIFFVDLPAGSPSKPPDPSEQCVQKLVAIAKSATAATLISSGDRVRIGSKEVRLRAQVEAEERSPDNKKYLIGLRVDVFVGGILQPLTFGSVGIGSARGDAIETAVSDWAMYVGDVLLGALGVKIGEEPLNVGPFLVYQGLVGVRGSSSPWSTEKNRQLLHRLDSLVKGLGHSPGELHSISLMILVEQDGTTQGECRVDGVMSPAALTAVQSFPWTQQGAAYVFKQFYVLRRR
jgi:hypothetical protein